MLSGQHYGKTVSPTTSVTSGEELENPKDRDPYTIVNFNSVYQFNDALQFTFSVKNLLDKSIFREGVQATAGANTYNEPGRSFLLAASYRF